MKFFVDQDIRKAETLPASFYQSEEVFEKFRSSVFRKSWQYIGEVPSSQQANIQPITLTEGFLQEPLLLTRDKSERLKCISNVCTHRANLLFDEPKSSNNIVCGYHGRRFQLDGTFISMPEFESAESFPRPCDSLKEFPLKNWNQFLFTGINPSFDFDDISDNLNERIGFLPINEFKLQAELSKNYLVNAHWALYCDNYLEGFHIPFVHKDLNAVLDYGSYETKMFKYGNLQIGYADSSEETFDLPVDHVDYGKNIAAYYFWFFPNMMFNFYPWGLSVNIVSPISRNKTKVAFLTYVFDDTKMHSGAGALLDKVEREDEFVVEGVHKGLQSSAYTTGRFSPTREKGVHQFHSLLAKFTKT